jgi:hypothetical protein
LIENLSVSALIARRLIRALGGFRKVDREMLQSTIPATIYQTEEAWNEMSFDLTYWRRVPEAEYDEWVDCCEDIDKQIESLLAGAGYVLGEITYWRDRSIELDAPELTDEVLYGLQRLLVGQFHNWRIAIMLWSELENGQHLGTILIDHDFFCITSGLSQYFPRAVQFA